MTSKKPTVYYDKSKGLIGKESIVVGASAYVFPVNHPSMFVSNEGLAITSTVLKHDKKTGEFETRNTIYKPLSKSQLKRITACKAGYKGK